MPLKIIEKFQFEKKCKVKKKVGWLVGFTAYQHFVYFIANFKILSWIRFYGISTFVGYLMLNPVYTYIAAIKNNRKISI